MAQRAEALSGRAPPGWADVTSDRWDWSSFVVRRRASTFLGFSLGRGAAVGGGAQASRLLAQVQGSGRAAPPTSRQPGSQSDPSARPRARPGLACFPRLPLPVPGKGPAPGRIETDRSVLHITVRRGRAHLGVLGGWIQGETWPFLEAIQLSLWYEPSQLSPHIRKHGRHMTQGPLPGRPGGGPAHGRAGSVPPNGEPAPSAE